MKGRYDLVVIGGSAGSLEVLLHTLPRLKNSLTVPIIIVVHRNKLSDMRLIHLLATRTNLPVKEPEEKEAIIGGTIYIAPPDYHLLIESNHSFSLDASEKVHHSRPSIDVTFESAALVFGPSLMCILLSGANADGADSLKIVKELGGFTIVQDPESAEQPFMPQQAIDSFAVDMILDKGEIADLINEL